MVIVRMLPDVEEWLGSDARSWSPISDDEYVAIIRRWRDTYLPSIAANTPSRRGIHAMKTIAERMPADVWVISGLRIPELANTGGRGATGYQVAALRNLRRELANRLELVVAAIDFSWTCVFSHEAGAFLSESLFEQTRVTF